MKRQTKRAITGPNAPVAPVGELDGYLTTADVCYETRYSRRWLNKLIHDGRFPKPDIPSTGTNTNRWRRSTIRDALNAMAGIAPAQP